MKTFTYELNGETLTAHFKDDIAFADIMAHAQAAADLCYDQEGNYHPEIENTVIQYAQLKLITDIDVPDSLDECYPIGLAVTDVVWQDDAPCEVWQQFNMLSKMVAGIIEQRNKVEHEQKVERALESLADSLGKACSKLNNVLDAAASLLTKADSTISQDNLNAMMTAMQEIRDKGIDEQKLVQAVMEQQGTKKPRKAVKRKKVVDLPPAE